MKGLFSFQHLHFVLLPSSLQPHLVRFLFGLLLSFLGLFFIWFGFIFGILLQKCDACSPHYSVSLLCLSQRTPFWGLGVKDQFPNKASPSGVGKGQVEGITPGGSSGRVESLFSALGLYRVHMSWLTPILENALVFHWELMAVWWGKWQWNVIDGVIMKTNKYQ